MGAVSDACRDDDGDGILNWEDPCPDDAAPGCQSQRRICVTSVDVQTGSMWQSCSYHFDYGGYVQCSDGTQSVSYSTCNVPAPVVPPSGSGTGGSSSGGSGSGSSGSSGTVTGNAAPSPFGNNPNSDAQTVANCVALRVNPGYETYFDKVGNVHAAFAVADRPTLNFVYGQVNDPQNQWIFADLEATYSTSTNKLTSITITVDKTKLHNYVVALWGGPRQASHWALYAEALHHEAIHAYDYLGNPNNPQYRSSESATQARTHAEFPQVYGTLAPTDPAYTNQQHGSPACLP